LMFSGGCFTNPAPVAAGASHWLSPISFRGVMNQAQQSVTGQEHWTRKGDIKLFLWEKFVGTPDPARPTVLFVHGSSMASQPTFDLTVPGRPDSSAMDWFAQCGFNTWCLDME